MVQHAEPREEGNPSYFIFVAIKKPAEFQVYLLFDQLTLIEICTEHSLNSLVEREPCVQRGLFGCFIVKVVIDKPNHLLAPGRS